MRKQLQTYLIQTEVRLRTPMDPEERAAFRADLLVHIGFFQHERLVHLIVTALFGLLAMLALLCGLVRPGMAVEALLLILLVVLGFYVRHYYHLENGVQKLYGLYEQIDV